MEIIIKYFLEAFKAILAIFGKTLPELEEGTNENLESMYDNITGYEPEV